MWANLVCLPDKRIAEKQHRLLRNETGFDSWSIPVPPPKEIATSDSVYQQLPLHIDIIYLLNKIPVKSQGTLSMKCKVR